MACKEIMRGHDLRCSSFIRKYYQQVVLININDVNERYYDVSNISHSIAFNLKENTKGYKFIGNEKTSLYSAGFSKSTKKGQPLYNHNVSLPVIGVGIETKLVLKELDLSNYFAAVQFKDETIEILGFENGLTSGDYSFDAQNSLGGISITLSSRFAETEPPYIYAGDKADFDNDFENIGTVSGGDFNNDFNNDFFIFEL